MQTATRRDLGLLHKSDTINLETESVARHREGVIKGHLHPKSTGIKDLCVLYDRATESMK